MKNPTQPDTVSGSQAVIRAIQLLKLFDDDQPYRTLAELTTASGLNRTTTFRLLAALESQELLRRTETGKYALGSEAIAIGGRAMRANKLRSVAHPYLQTLAEATGETITLEVLRYGYGEAPSTLVIDEVTSRHLVGITQYIGSRLPLATTSSGKALLCWSVEPERQALLALLSPASAKKLLQEFPSFLTQGFATASGELELGLMACAAPIFDASQSVRAALSLVGPSVRIQANQLHNLAQQVALTAQQISFALGWRDSP
ncbi:MAG TPA: IclR family transcriptional regulator [Anaerolineales bacterium]|nr:IclR family transcriptional regulator [Anaerolineales bacterium]